jgi:hypothetical protein
MFRGEYLDMGDQDASQKLTRDELDTRGRGGASAINV